MRATIAAAVCALTVASSSVAGASTATYEPFRAVHQFGSYGNLAVGDCVLAAAADLEQLELRAKTPLRAGPLRTLYRVLSPADNGVTWPQLFAQWESGGVDGHTITSEASVPLDQSSIESAIRSDGGLLGSVAMPEANVDVEMPSKWVQVWSLDNTGPLSWGYHAVALVGYSPLYLYLVSWGSVMAVTWAWWAKYGNLAVAIGGLK